MKTIHKYELELTLDIQNFVGRENAEYLDVQMQNGSPVLWVRVDLGEPEVNRAIKFAWTEKPAPEGQYVGTVQSSSGILVWHLFLLP